MVMCEAACALNMGQPLFHHQVIEDISSASTETKRDSSSFTGRKSDISSFTGRTES
jgi:hypothetical protein